MSIISVEILKKNISFYDVLIKIEKEYHTKIYIVGGCVRDILLNIPLHDIDIVSENMEYTKLAKILAKNIKTNTVPFKDNIRLMKNNTVIDVSKLRGKNIYEDVLKRDFTINNIACDLYGSLIGSTIDLDNKLIKAVYHNTFDDDPLRIIRAVRFVSIFGFDIDNNTLNIAISKNSLLKYIAKERVLEEFRKMFKGAYLKKAINIIKTYNLFSPLIDINKLDNIKLLNAITYTNDFSLLISIWCKDEIFIKYLGLTSKEYKNISIYLNIDYDFLKTIDDKGLKYFIFQNIPLIENIIIYIRINFNDKALSNKINTLYKTMDFNNINYINGSILMSLGFTPSPLFSEIINEVSFLLAINELNKDNIEDYIKNRWC